MNNGNNNSKRISSPPWRLASLAMGGVCGGMAYVVSASMNVAILIGTLTLGCLWLGYWAARRGNDSFLFDQDHFDATDGEIFYSGDVGKKKNPATLFASVAIEATPIPVIIIDQAGRIVTTNQAARERYALGRTSIRFNDAVRRPEIIDIVEKTLADRRPRTIDMETRLPVDRYERVSVAQFNADGASFALVSVQDETEARMSEKMRADFLANASHELRTPLAAILGFIETLRGPARDDELARERFLEVMYGQASRMSRLISDLLSLSRIELNEHVPPTGHSNLSSAVYEAADSLTPDKKQRIIVDVSQEPLWVLGDRDELVQIIMNLIDNGLKYSGAKGQIKLSTKSHLVRDDALNFAMRQWPDAARLPLTSPPVERERLYGVLRVEDNGDGIERQHFPRLAERFYRVETLASGKSGTGLGLAIVKHIVSRHRGGLVVESELGRGSAFSIYLPQPFSDRVGANDMPAEAAVT